MPTSDDFKTELYRIMNEALFEGKSSAEINAGDLHRRVGGYPVPITECRCAPWSCSRRWTVFGAGRVFFVGLRVLDFAPEAGDVITEEPPSGRGANL